MLLLFSIRVAERPHVWKIAVPSVYYACLSWMFINLQVSFFRFGFEGGMEDLVVLFPDYCLSIHFSYPSMVQNSKDMRQDVVLV